jgi:hypothetical protein
MSSGASLFNQLGGLEQVTKLASNYGSKLLADSRVSKFLGEQAVTSVSNGLVNEIAKASGMKPPIAGDNLYDTLKDAQLDRTAVGALTENLEKTATEANLGSEAKTGLMAVMTPITNKLLSDIATR